MAAKRQPPAQSNAFNGSAGCCDSIVAPPRSRFTPQSPAPSIGRPGFWTIRPVEGHWALGIPWSNAHQNPAATITIHYWGNNEEAANIHFLVKGARVLWRDQSYALYFTSRNSPKEYVHGEPLTGRFLFNMSWRGNYENWIGTWELNANPPTITFFVAIEDDDGRPFDPLLDMDKVVFVGTSVMD